MPSKMISFRDDAIFERFNRAGQSPSLLSQRAIHRYFSLLDHAKRSVNLTVAEASLICDAGNGCLWGNFELSPKSLVIETQDAIALEGLDKKWSIDKERLFEKLGGYDHFQCAAIVEAIEQFWLIDPNSPEYPGIELQIAVAFKNMISED